MSRAGKVRGSSTALSVYRHNLMTKRNIFGMAVVALLLVVFAPGRAWAQADCLACHADKGLQDAAGHNISVDGETFAKSIHGSLKCSDCHADIKDYPHPEKIAKVKCDTCHSEPGSGTRREASTPMRPSIPAPVVMAMRMPSSPRTTSGRRCTR